MQLYRGTIQTTVQMDVEIVADSADEAARIMRELGDDVSRNTALPPGMDWCGEWDILDDVEPVESSEAGGAR